MEPLEQFHTEVCDAFNRTDLAMLVRFRLGEQLGNITNERGPMRDIVFDLIGWAEQQGRLGELVRTLAAERPLREKMQSAAAKLGFGVAAPPEPIFEVPPDMRPPEPGPVVDLEDPQAGRWGGRSESGGRRLSAKLGEVLDDYFYLDLVVESTDGSPLNGPVVFHLHDTYPKSVIWIRKIRNGSAAMLEGVTAYGVYTAAAQVKNAAGQWIGLELDISGLGGLPSKFKEI